MNHLTYSAFAGTRDELYRTTPFEFDSSGAALSRHAVVTITISEPIRNWFEHSDPFVFPFQIPRTVPAIEKNLLIE